MIKLTNRGSFKETIKALEHMRSGKIYDGLDQYARAGVNALDNATPVETGVTSDSWGYTIKQNKKFTSIMWTNSHEVDGAHIVILLQYGHGTGTGGYVAGRDFINPAIRPVFEEIAAAVWKNVVNA
jgi:hypothetical protein